ncbi:helix-turn-helix transcriptional regulator [Rugosimonospora acidiphila]|uniref:Helix-turn-helix transcriptional regulator n=1 Tax=Rugosimonospora acidiphila TaxID=556531 RepID=A0ABP9S5D6_9ACTN
MVREPLTEQEIAQGHRIGALLRAARGARTLGAVAREAGLSVETLRKIETGRIPTPSFVTVAALADELRLSLDEIWRIAREESAPGRDAAAS